MNIKYIRDLVLLEYRTVKVEAYSFSELNSHAVSDARPFALFEGTLQNCGPQYTVGTIIYENFWIVVHNADRFYISQDMIYVVDGNKIYLEIK